MATTYTPANGASIDYTPSDVTAHSDQRLNVFAPTASLFPVPADGYPVMLHFVDTGFSTTSLLTSITQASAEFLHAFLEMGGVVISVSVSVSKTLGNDYGAPNHGLGLFYPPGHTSGNYEDVTYPMAEKDVIYAIQYVRKNAADVSGTGIKINPDKIATNGVSGGAIITLWAAAGPDRSEGGVGALGVSATDTQYGFSTRPNISVLRLANPCFTVFDGTQDGNHFNKDGMTETPATTLSQVEAGLLTSFSATTYESAVANVRGGTRWIYVIGDTNVSHDFVAPYESLETSGHSALGAFIWKTLYPALTTIWNQGNFTVHSNGSYTAERALTDYFHETSAALQAPEAFQVAQIFGMVPVRVLDKKTTNASFRIGVPAVTTTGTTASAVNEVVVAPNPYRRNGVWVWNCNDSAATSNTALVTTGTVAVPGTAYLNLRPYKAVSNAIRGVFIPGTGGVLIKRASATNITWQAMEF